jgi:hypothetical protein
MSQKRSPVTCYGNFAGGFGKGFFAPLVIGASSVVALTIDFCRTAIFTAGVLARAAQLATAMAWLDPWR